jgi:hypothetical protein
MLASPQLSPPIIVNQHVFAEGTAAAFHYKLKPQLVFVERHRKVFWEMIVLRTSAESTY